MKKEGEGIDVKFAGRFSPFPYSTNEEFTFHLSGERVTRDFALTGEQGHGF